MVQTLTVGTLALVIEAAIGYPNWLQRSLGHPVQAFGWLIAWLERHLNVGTASDRARRLMGCFSLIVLVGAAWLTGVVIDHATSSLLPPVPALILRGIIASTLLAQRSLYQHVEAVGVALRRGGITEARTAVSSIVGRNPQALDEAGVLRAAIESLAENFSDAVVAPVFWCVLLGLPGLLVYKAVNTADSMIGHRTARFAAFGWASARFDDVLNLPGSRLSVLWLILAAGATKGASAFTVFRTVQRDATKHRSPNAGWPEAAMAGALGLRLNGPRVYGETRVEDAWMGEGSSQTSILDLSRSLLLYRKACFAQLVVATTCIIGLAVPTSF